MKGCLELVNGFLKNIWNSVKFVNLWINEGFVICCIENVGIKNGYGLFLYVVICWNSIYEIYVRNFKFCKEFVSFMVEDIFIYNIIVFLFIIILYLIKY